VLVTLDMHIADISQHHTALPEPAVKRQCVSCFDVNDARSVLLVDQRTNKRAKMICERASGAANERDYALICSFHDVPPAGGSARRRNCYVQRALSIDAR
jgi:hypothetical protein